MKNLKNKTFFEFLLFFWIFGVGIWNFAGEAQASGASLNFSPGSGTFFVGSTFDISILLNTNKNNINAVRADIKFDPKKIQIASPTTGRSFISVWIAQPNYSNVQGTASFQGGVPSPGINTTAGLVSTITFRVMAPGETAIYFTDNSQVLLNDGLGTNILNSKNRGVYELKIPPPEGPKVFSSTHPDQNKWYKNNNPSFSWEKEEGVTDFSYAIDNDFAAIPDNIAKGNQTSVSYADLQDGIWYFHIKAKKSGVWGGVTNYVIQVDATPPASFTIDFEPKLKSQVYTSREPIVTFITTDALSGIDHYELKTVDFSNKNGTTGFFTEVSSPYKVPGMTLGENEIIVRAFDAAGNWQDSSKKLRVIPAEKLFYITNRGVNIWIFFLPWWLLILLIFLLLMILLIIIILNLRKEGKIEKGRQALAKLKEKAQKDTWINT